VVQGLRARGVLVRSVARRPVIQGSFRLTIGTRADMERFLTAFRHVIRRH
jgi:histidinol-phosphate aminotransferase